MLSQPGCQGRPARSNSSCSRGNGSHGIVNKCPGARPSGPRYNRSHHRCFLGRYALPVTLSLLSWDERRPNFLITPLSTNPRTVTCPFQHLAWRVDADRAVLACRITEPDRWCHRCGEEGTSRDTVTRQLAHEPFGWRPTTLLVTVRRYPLRRLYPCVAPRQQRYGPSTGQVVTACSALGSGSHCVPTSERGTGRRSARGVVEHRQQRGAGRR
jgi:hypothetical protein